MKKKLLVAAGVVGVAVLGVFAYQSLAGCCGTGGGCGSGMAMAAPPATSSAPASKPTGFINARCPIMGNKIDPNNVPESLTRVYKGQKVAFCCGGCPAKWDKLTDAEKDAKLEAAK